MKKVRTTFLRLFVSLLKFPNKVNYVNLLKAFQQAYEKEEEKGKTLFGSYKSPLLSDLDKVKQKYEKDQVFLTETAQLIVQYVKYEM